MPVQSRMTAPIAMAMTLVSPIEPGMKPNTMSARLAFEATPCAISPSGVAQVKVSGSVLPKPKIVSLATQTASPDIFVG